MRFSIAVCQANRYEPHRFEAPRVVPGAYSVHANRPFVWMQRLCCWTLRKLRCEHSVMEETVRYSSVTVDRAKLTDLVRDQMLNARECGWPLDRIVVGAEDLRRICEEADAVPLQNPYALGIEGTLLGVPVQIVPWVRGVVAVPRMQR